jgi:hypothetical protein
LSEDDFDSSASGRITRLAVISQIYRENLAHSVPACPSSAVLVDLLHRVDEIEAAAKAAIEADPAPFNYSVVRVHPDEDEGAQ